MWRSAHLSLGLTDSRGILVATLLWPLLVMAGSGTAAVVGQDADDDDKERATVSRFVTVLEKNPRRGTAFDKVYGFHVERGSLDELLKEYQSDVEKTEGVEAASKWIIIGLIEARRGRDQEALLALQQAERLDPTSPLASFYLGQTFAMAGQAELAAEAMERAIERKPAPLDQLEIYQSLGRIYQRLFKTEKALQVWQRLEQQFPNDLRVQEQIATTLLEENDLTQALPRLEQLARMTKDQYRRSLFQIEAAGVKVRLGRSADGLKDFESILSQLNSESWLYRDVRRRIEAIYLNSNNQTGLIDYYEQWIQKTPEDFDAVSRLVKQLLGSGRSIDAQKWLQRSLKTAPSNKELRMALIGILLSDFKFHEAANHYQELDRHDPNNPDTLKDWGQALLKDKSMDLAHRHQQAAIVWKRLIASRPHDAHTASQVAELFRRAEMIDDAIEQYKRAIDLAPDAAQYREYLGEYLQTLHRPGEAVATWREIASGPRKSPANVARLSEVLAQFGLLGESIETNAEACQLDPKDLNLQFKRADLLTRADRHEEALEQLSKIETMLDSDEEREAWLQRQLGVLKSLNLLKSRIAETRNSLDRDLKIQPQSAERWYWLARAYESDGQLREALTAINKASQNDPGSIRILSAAARLNESQKNLRIAIDLNMRLVAINRRQRTDYLRQISLLEEKLGRREPALKAGREFLTAAAGNADACDFFAQLCFRLGQFDEGIQTLRRSLRFNPGDVVTMMKLASALRQRKQNPESIEILWRAFDRSRSLDERLSIVQQLAEAAVNQDQLIAIIARLDRDRRDPATNRESTLCLARVYETIGRLIEAQKELESLLTDETRDVDLLTHLRQLAERQKNYEAAVRFQRQVWNISLSKVDRYHLAQLLLLASKADDAVDLLSENQGARELTGELLRLLDSLNQHGRPEEVLNRVRALRTEFPENWELLYREAMSLVKLGDPDASKTLIELLKLNCPEDDPSLVFFKSTRTPPANVLSLRVLERMNDLNTIQQMTQIAQSQPKNQAARSTTAQPVKIVTTTTRPQQMSLTWSPRDFGAARMAAWAWLTRFGNVQIQTAFPELNDPSTRQQLIDAVVIHTLQNNFDKKRQILRQLMALSEDDIEAKILYLGSLSTRQATGVAAVPGKMGLSTDAPNRVLHALEKVELEQAITAFSEIAAREDLSRHSVMSLATIVTEMRLAGRAQAARELAADLISRLNTKTELAYLIYSLRRMNFVSGVAMALDRLCEVEDTGSSVSSTPILLPANTLALVTSTENLPGVLLPIMIDTAEPEDLKSIWFSYIRLLARQPIQTTTSRANSTAAPATVNPTQIQSVSPSFSPANQGRVLVPTSPGGPNPITINPAIPGSNSPPAPTANGTFTPSNGAGSVTISSVNQNSIPGVTIPGVVFTNHGAAMLLAVRRKFHSIKRTDELIAEIERRSNDPETNDDERLLWQHSLAVLHWVDDKKSLSLSILADVVKKHPDRKELAVKLASQYETANEPALALKTLDSVTAENPAEEGQFERLALRLASATDNTERIKLALQRLSQGNVSNQELVPFTEKMLTLGLLAEAEVILNKAADSGQIGVGTLNILMKVQMASGKKENAATTALELLERLDKMQATEALRQSTQSGERPASAQPRVLDEMRLASYRVLRESGKLEGIIESYESQFKALPRSETLLDLLVTLHSAAGNDRKVAELQIEKLKRNVDKKAVRYELAIRYFELGQSDDSFEHLQTLLDLDADYFATRCRATLHSMCGRDGDARLTGLLQKMDWGQSNKRLAILPSIIEQLRRCPATAESGILLFTKTWKDHPERRIDLLQRFPDDQWWQLKDISEELQSVLVPKDSEGLQNQWSVFGRTLVRYDDVDAGLVTVWNRMLSNAKSRADLDAMAATIERGINQFPEFTAGTVMLAMIDLRRDRIAAGRDTLDRLRPDLERVLQTRTFVAWEIGQELARHSEAMDVGAKYLTEAIRQSGRTDWKTRSSPGGYLIACYVEHGRKSDAKDYLLSRVSPSVRPGSDRSQIPTPGDFSNMVSIGERLRSLGFPIDGMELYLDSLERGGDSHREVQGSLLVALGELTPEMMVEYLENFDGKSRQLKIYPILFRSRLQSRWDNLLKRIVAYSELSTRAISALERLSQTQQDGTPLVMMGLIAAASRDQKALQSVLSKMDTLSGLKEDSDPDTTLEKSCVGFWLVARECLTDPSLAEIASRVAQKSLEASRRHSPREMVNAILKEWLSVATSIDDKAMIDRVKREFEPSTPR